MWDSVERGMGVGRVEGLFLSQILASYDNQGARSNSAYHIPICMSEFQGDQTKHGNSNLQKAEILGKGQTVCLLLLSTDTDGQFHKPALNECGMGKGDIKMEQVICFISWLQCVFCVPRDR